MWKRLKQIDVGFLVVLLICFVAIWPFLSRAGLPRETDAELHIYRLAELSRLVRGGELYPRWSPHFYYGYGYPIFNFYAPLAYYLGLLIELLPPFDAVEAVKALFVAGLLVAGVAMYGFVRDNWGRSAGFVAAAAYVYAPYIQYVDPHARGDLAESLSFAAFPLALWALHRFMNSGRALPWLASVIAVAGVILSHNLMAMVFFALLTGWVAWQWVLQLVRRRRGRNAASKAIGPTGKPLPASVGLLPLALLLGVGLSAFFWLPVALEQDAVNLSSLIGDGSHFDFRNHFLSLSQLLAPTQMLDWGATEQRFVFGLGIAQWLLGLTGIVFIILGRVRQRGEALYFVIAFISVLFLMTSASLVVWELVPLLEYLQFPWRLLGPAVALLAVLAGAGAEGLLTLLRRYRRAGSWLTAALVGGILLSALPLSQIPPWPGDFGDTGRKEIVDIELAGRWVGTTSTADFVPATVDVLPQPNNAVLWNFWTGEPLERINRATLPDGAAVVGGEVTPLHFRYQVDAPKPFLLRFFVFAFPGWNVRVNGETIKTEVGRPEGFIVAPVPAGSYELELIFAGTPARDAAWLLSGISLLATVVTAFAIHRRPPSIPERSDNPPAWQEAGWIWPTAAVVLILTLSLALILEPAGWLHHTSSDYTAAPANEHIFADFGGQIALIGFDAPDSAHAGETIEVTLYWQAQHDLDINYQVFVHLLYPDERTVLAQSDKLNPAGFPSQRWPTDKYVRDVHTLTIPEGAEPGEYLLTSGLWVQSEGWRLPLWDDNGAQIGDNYLLRIMPVE